MSNLWKMYGLGCSREDFLDDIAGLQRKIQPRTDDDKLYQEGLVDVDRVLFKWYCPLGHLDVQLFYDAVFVAKLWTDFRTIVETRKLDTSGVDASEPNAQAYWQVLGLVCIDPWRNDAEHRKGFRVQMRADKNTPDRFGFRLDTPGKEKIHAALNVDAVYNAMERIALLWDPISFGMMSIRSDYRTLMPIEIPRGWIRTS
jgi:hypothetical protein